MSESRNLSMERGSIERGSMERGPATAAPRSPAPRKRRRKRHEMLRIGGGISTPWFIGIAVAVFALLLGIWWLITATEMVEPLFLPSPSEVFESLRHQIQNGQLWDDARVSVYRVLIGFALATVMAIPIGVLIGTYRVWEAAVEPLVDFIRYMPVVAFVPLTILWSGTGDTQKFLIIWIGTFFQQVLLIMDNVKRVPMDYVNLGYTLGLKDRSILARIIIPSSAPGIWDSMRISLGWAWTWLVLAELVAATSGLGYRINTAQRYFETDLIIGYILVLGCLGLIFDQVMKFLSRRMFKYEEAR